MARRDFGPISKIYIDSFGGSLWREFKKCKGCGQKYGIDEVKQFYENDIYLEEDLYTNQLCDCGEKLVLVPYFTKASIIERLSKDSFEEGFLGIVSENEIGEVVGFRWNKDINDWIKNQIGEFIPAGRYSFSCDMAVKRDNESEGIATILYQQTINLLRLKEYKGIITTTQENSRPYLIYTGKIGFSNLKDKFDNIVYYKERRPWLIKRLGELK